MKQTGEDGFTLIETLASLLVTAIVVAALSAFTGDWLHGWRTGNLHASGAHGLGLIHLRLTRDIEGALASADPTHPGLVGGAQSMTLVHEALDYGIRGKLETIRFDADEQGVIRRSGTQSVLLLPGFYRFSYADAAMHWTDSWRSTILPAAVRLMPIDDSAAIPIIIRITTSRPGLCAAVSSATLCTQVAQGQAVQRSLLDDNALLRIQGRQQ